MEEYRQITLDEWTQWKEDIRKKLEETAGNFVYIGYRLKQIRDSGMYGGAADIFEFAEKEYSLGKSTVSRFIAINERYSEGGNSLELKEEFRNFSSSKLSEMLTLPDSELELITEKTTIREIRELKAFNNKEPETEGRTEGVETGKTVEAAGGEERKLTPLEKCLVDFFKDKKGMLNGIMQYLEEEPPAYKEAAELMAPSQISHKKGIVFLFLYDWNTGVKYKMITKPDPVSIGWAEFLNIIYGIFGACARSDVWGDYYKEPEETLRGDAENCGFTESNHSMDPVATSQQDAWEKQAGEQKETVEKAENQSGQEAAGVGDEESRNDEAQGENRADVEQAGEPADDIKPADEEHGADGGTGEDGAEGSTDCESGTGDTGAESGQGTDSEAAGVTEEQEKPEKTGAEDDSAGVENADGEKKGKRAAGVDFANTVGFAKHVEKEKAKIREKLSRMESLCESGDWDGLVGEAGYVITLAESVKSMQEVFHG